MPDLLEHLENRRTIPAANLTVPGPTKEELNRILTIAARVPDHGKLAPWRFITYQPTDADTIGCFLEKRWHTLDPQADPERLAIEKARFHRAATIIGVVSKAQPHPKIPEWEQFISAGAVCMNLIHAAFAFGYVAQWLSEWYSDDPEASEFLGCQPGERFAGFLYIGTPTLPPTERARPDLSEIVTPWT